MSTIVHFRDESNSLYHHGIKGQKWGIRRYQNEDGSLTPEGKKRYNDSENIKSGIKYGVGAAIGVLGSLGTAGTAGLSTIAESNIKDPGKKPSRDDYKNDQDYKNDLATYVDEKDRYDEKKRTVSGLAKEAPKIESETNKIAQKIIADTKRKDIERIKKDVDVSKISDEQLRKSVNRMQLERQYTSLTTPETTKGSEVALTVMSAIGGLASIAVSGMAIAYYAKGLSKGN